MPRAPAPGRPGRVGPGRDLFAIANWKMNKRLGEAEAWVRAIRSRRPRGRGVQVMVAPAFIHLQAVVRQARGGRLGVAAQDCHPEPQGSFTGEVSAPMIGDAGGVAAIVGHSERRRLNRESDDLVRAKVRAAIAADLRPILCVGETLAERRRGRMERVIERQIASALGGLGGARASGLIVAYEPVWAIGTGRHATPAEAAAAIAFVRSCLGRTLGAAAAARTPILYGGSVTAANAGSVLAAPEIDGALVGGASLEAESFAAIVAAIEGIARGRRAPASRPRPGA